MNNFPINSIREDFPILKSKINNHDLIYFDNAATTQKPNSVIDASGLSTIHFACHSTVSIFKSLLDHGGSIFNRDGSVNQIQFQVHEKFLFNNNI